MNITFNNDGIPYRFDDLGSGGDKHLSIKYSQYESIELRVSQQPAKGIGGLFGKKTETYAIVISYYPRRLDKTKLDTKVIVITPEEIEQAKTAVDFVSNLIVERTCKKKHKSLKDRLTYAYIRKVKKQMLCPACREGNMHIDHKSTMWQCEHCGYKLSADEFEDDYVFWFCDNCNAYLNIQDKFDVNNKKWKCLKCGFKNDLTSDNIKGICVDCGKTISDPDQTLCDDCKAVRRNKSIERLKAAQQILSATADIANTAASLCKTPNSSGPDHTEQWADTGTDDSTDDYGTTIFMKCSNCGNEDARSLWNEGDTIYCSKCTHRTRVDTHVDDLVKCPYCHFMRDRKAFYCRHCNTAWGSEPISAEETEELRSIIKLYE